MLGKELMRVNNFPFSAFVLFRFINVNRLLQGKWTEIAWFLPAEKCSSRLLDSH
jgi:hypothetical protein